MNAEKGRSVHDFHSGLSSLVLARVRVRERAREGGWSRLIRKRVSSSLANDTTASLFLFLSLLHIPSLF